MLYLEKQQQKSTKRTAFHLPVFYFIFKEKYTLHCKIGESEKERVTKSGMVQ
jgi:hypothetical protein